MTRFELWISGVVSNRSTNCTIIFCGQEPWSRFELWVSCVVSNRSTNCATTTAQCYLIVSSAKHLFCGQEPWSSVWIPASYMGWTFSTYICFTKSLFEIDENKQKEVGAGPFKKHLFVWWSHNLRSFKPVGDKDSHHFDVLAILPKMQKLRQIFLAKKREKSILKNPIWGRRGKFVLKIFPKKIENWNRFFRRKRKNVSASDEVVLAASN